MKETHILDFPIPTDGQGEKHKDAYADLSDCYWILLGKKPPQKYSAENYCKLYETIQNNIIIKKRKPRKCPKCEGKVLRILYGEPNLEYLESCKETFAFGGCCVVEGGAVWQCDECYVNIYRERDLLEALDNIRNKKYE